MLRRDVDPGSTHHPKEMQIRNLKGAQLSNDAQSAIDKMTTIDKVPIADKIMVCIGPNRLSNALVPAAERMAASQKASWTAVYIENPRDRRLNKKNDHRVEIYARMAERSGGTFVKVQGHNIGDEIIAYAKANRIKKIILGKPLKPVWKIWLHGSLADKVMRKREQIDVYVVTNEDNEAQSTVKNELTSFQPTLYLWAILVTAALTAFGMALGDLITPIDQALIYVTGVVLLAAKLGRGSSLLYSFLSVTCFNFFFIPPIYTFSVYDRSYWLTFGVMLTTSFVITSQASRLRHQAIVSRKRERDTQNFYSLTKKLASARGREEITTAATLHVKDMLDAEVALWLPNEHGQLKTIARELSKESSVKEGSVVKWCFDSRQVAGRHTPTMPSANGLYFPMIASSGALGVMGITVDTPTRDFSRDELASLETFAHLLASALERINIAELAEQSKLDTQTEKLRAMLLSSVSHDLRTPLASIIGASSTIADDIDKLTLETIRDLGLSINKEAGRLSHIVINLLEVTRLESETLRLNKQPYFIEELIGSAIDRLGPILSKHIVVPKADETLPLVAVDGVLIEQLLINLLENAARYTPEGSTITICTTAKNASVCITVSDNGPGIPSGQEKKVFDKFYTIDQSDGHKGTGLGLAICAGIVKAHQGEIWIEANADGGACFCFTLPVAVELDQGVRNVALR